MNYNWKRYWVPFNGQINFGDHGFLTDPDDAFGKIVNPDLDTFDKIHDQHCVIILGEPGIGKTTEFKKLSEMAQNVLYLDLRDIQDIEVFKDFLLPRTEYSLWKNGQSSLTLFLDSFDEMILNQDKFSSFLSNLLTNSGGNLSQLSLRVACRNLLWSETAQNNLQKIWDKPIEIIELCPLTKKDVLLAANLNQIDEHEFLSAIIKNDLAALAGKPLTLKMLISIFKEKSSLPSGKVDLFRRGVEFLLQEIDPSKINSSSRPRTDLNKRKIIAEKLAALMTLSAKGVLVLSIPESGLSDLDLLVDDVCGDEFTDTDHSLQISRDEVIETLNTGIFSSRGNSKVGWSHLSFGEFLTAEYLNRHNLTWEQQRSLLFQRPFSFNDYKLIPQLYETAIWLASLDGEFYNRVLDTDPEILLKTDFKNSSTDKQKELLVQRLLQGIEEGDFIENWELLNVNNYEKLCHPNISAQLKPIITNTKMSISTRRQALLMVRACKLNDLKEELLSIVLNPEEKIELKSAAALGLGSNLTESEKKLLAKLLNDQAMREDDRDELKGSILECLNVDYLPNQRLFDLITAPKRSSFYGQYYFFVSYTLIPQLSKVDLKIALDWVQKTEPADWHLDAVRRKLSEAILLEGLKRLHEPGVMEVYSRVALKRLKDDRHIIEQHTIDDDVSKEFFELIESDVERKRLLVKGIVEAIVAEDSGEAVRRQAYYLRPRETKLLSNEDFDWLLSWIYSEKNTHVKEILFELIKDITDILDPRQSDCIYTLSHVEPLVFEMFKYWFTPVELGSEAAKQMKEDWLESQGIEDRWANNRRARLSEELSLERIHGDLDRIRNKNLDAVWELHRDLCAYNHDLDEEDLEKLHGWELLDQSEKELVIAAGEDYLRQNSANPSKWLGKGNLYFPDLTAYRYIKYYANREPSYLDKQDEDFWRRWASIAVGFPHMNHDDEASRIAQKAMLMNPKESLSVFDTMVEDENERHGSLFVTRLFDGFWNDSLCDLALEKIKSGRLKKRALRELLEKNIRYGSIESIEYAKSLIKLPLPSETEDKEVVIDLASLLLSLGEWGFIWNLMQSDKEFGRLLVEDTNYITQRSQAFLMDMSEADLKDLFVWMMTEYPDDEDPELEGVHTVTPRRSVASFRGNVLSALMTRGTPEACSRIEEIANIFPTKEWIRRYTLIQAKKNTLEKRWTPLKVNEIAQIISNLHKRSIASAAELLDLVMDMLDRFQNDLKTGEPPKIMRLWNDPRKKIGSDKRRQKYYSPKLEDDLSNEVKIFLQERLEGKMVVVNREVQIVKGNETDVHIVAQRTEKQVIQTEEVIIEVKGCWNPELETSMKSQLVDRYLKISGRNHGVYLIGWFKCDKWNDPDDIKTKNDCPSYDFDEACNHFEEQARGLSTGNIVVKPYILDARI